MDVESNEFCKSEYGKKEDGGLRKFYKERSDLRDFIPLTPELPKSEVL